MKKYLFGAVTIALAVVFSAFSFPAKKTPFTPVTFRYLAPGGSYSEVYVESTAPSSWQPDHTISCNQFNTIACSITVPVSETIDGNGLELDTSKVTIIAAGSGSIFRVHTINVSFGSATFKNKSN